MYKGVGFLPIKTTQQLLATDQKVLAILIIPLNNILRRFGKFGICLFTVLDGIWAEAKVTVVRGYFSKNPS
jgi:hypothetical protein